MAMAMAKAKREQQHEDDEEDQQQQQQDHHHHHHLAWEHQAGKQEEAEEEEAAELRRGPWTVDEDLTLINYIADHGEGRWNALARAAGTCIYIPGYHTVPSYH